MRDIPEAEARAMLSAPLQCIDCPDWEPLRAQPGTLQTGVGVLDLSGVGTRMFVQLVYRNSQKTKFVRYIFSVFFRQPYGLERIYQLEIVHSPRQIDDLHKKSHEHIGNTRLIGNATWQNWDYDEVLAHFCKQTNIEFKPNLFHPEHFQLRG